MKNGYDLVRQFNTDGTFRTTFENINCMTCVDRPIVGKIEKELEMEWRLSIKKLAHADGAPTLQVQLECNPNSFSPLWSSVVQYEMWVARQPGHIGLRHKPLRGTKKFNHLNKKVDIPCFMSWETLMKPRNNFILDDSIVVVVIVKLLNCDGIQKKVTEDMQFSREIEGITDCVLQVDDEKLFVSKQILATNSEFFNNLFNKPIELPNGMTVAYEVKDVDFMDFLTFLRFIYNPDAVVTLDNYEMLLSTANMYKADRLLNKVEDFLIRTNGVNDAVKLIHAENCVFARLQDSVLVKYRTPAALQHLKHLPEYPDLTESTLCTVFKRYMATLD